MGGNGGGSTFVVMFCVMSGDMRRKVNPTKTMSGVASGVGSPREAEVCL